ncbi:MAG: RHS repeat-associated core domain-containing protein [Actinomycetales bacterium]
MQAQTLVDPGDVSGSLTTSYTYTGAGEVPSVVDPAGRITTHGYDQAGNLVSTTLPDGRVTRMAYSARGQVSSITDASGAVTSMVYDGAGNLVSTTTPGERTVSATYNGDGTVATSTDAAGQTTTYAYDRAGNRVRVVSPAGRVAAVQVSVLGWVMATIDPRGQVAGADRAAFTTTMGRDAAGRVTSMREPTGVMTSTAYSVDGNPVEVVDASGGVTRFGYDGVGRLTSVTDPDGRTTRTEYDAAARVRAVVDPAGATTTTGYDVFGRPVRVLDPTGRTASQTYTRAGVVGSRTGPDGQTTRYEYDSSDRVVSVTGPGGGVSRTGWDVLDRVVSVSDPDGRVVRTEYTPSGQVERVRRPDGSVLEYGYDVLDRRVWVSDPSGTSRYGYDADGLVVSVVDPVGRATAMGWDAAGNQVSSTTSVGVVSRRFDAGRRVMSVDNPGSAADVEYGYDAAGRVVSMRDGTGVSSYAYSPAGRLVAYTNGASATVGYGYDAAGRVARVQYPSGRDVLRGYDAAGRLVTVSDGVGRTARFSADAGGRVGGVSLPNGVSTAYSYTADGQVAELVTSRGAGSVVSDVASFSAGGLLTSRAGGEGAQGYSWDALARLDEVSLTASGGGSSAVDVGFDEAGRVSTVGGSVLTYDGWGQVSGAVRGMGGQSRAETVFAFDGAGNRVGQSTTISGTQTQSGMWDVGPLGSGSWVFDVDEVNRLRGVSGPGVEAGYGYDGAGLRAWRTSGGMREDFVWDVVAGVPVVLADGEHEYVYGQGTTPLWQVETGTGVVEYLHADVTGSVVAVTDAAGVVAGTRSYEAYGRVTGSTGEWVTRFGFAGEYTDPDTGLVYLRARYYDPDTAQFMSVDPVVEQTRTAYGYTAGNPLQFADPTGLDWLQDASDWTAGFGDTLTFGGTAQIRRLINYAVWGEDSDMVDHCSTFYRWGSRGGMIAGTGLTVIEGLSLARVAWASRGVIQAALRDPATTLTRLTGSLTTRASTITRTLRPKPRPATTNTAANGAAGASNAANGVRLAQQLARESAESAFTASGGLRTEVIQGSSRIIDGSRLGNPDVVKALTADGSNIADWGKYTTQTFQSPSGPFQAHFYYNPVTGAANYSVDYKIVFNGMPR